MNVLAESQQRDNSDTLKQLSNIRHKAARFYYTIAWLSHQKSQLGYKPIFSMAQ